MARDMSRSRSKGQKLANSLEHPLTLPLDAKGKKFVKEIIFSGVKKATRIVFPKNKTEDEYGFPLKGEPPLQIKVFIPRDYTMKDLKGFFGLENRIRDNFELRVQRGLEIEITPVAERRQSKDVEADKSRRAR